MNTPTMGEILLKSSFPPAERLINSQHSVLATMGKKLLCNDGTDFIFFLRNAMKAFIKDLQMSESVYDKRNFYIKNKAHL